EQDRSAEIQGCFIPIAPSGRDTAAKGDPGKIVLLFSQMQREALAALTANGVAWRLVETDNPSGSGVTISENGGAIIGDGDCGTFSIRYQLIIECSDSGWFGFGKTEIVTSGTFTLTRTP